MCIIINVWLNAIVIIDNFLLLTFSALLSHRIEVSWEKKESQTKLTCSHTRDQHSSP